MKENDYRLYFSKRRGSPGAVFIGDPAKPVVGTLLALPAVMCGFYSYFGIAVASNPYSLSIFWPSGDKIYMANLQASFGAPFLTKRP
jgi:hypothetical protein